MTHELQHALQVQGGLNHPFVGETEATYLRDPRRYMQNFGEIEARIAALRDQAPLAVRQRMSFPMMEQKAYERFNLPEHRGMHPMSESVQDMYNWVNYDPMANIKDFAQ
jgi:hypothetical protein